MPSPFRKSILYKPAEIRRRDGCKNDAALVVLADSSSNPHLTNMMLTSVTCTAQSHQVIFGVVTAATASIDVMDVQLSSATARLTPPTIAR
jgi:hypothetical protein